MPPKAPKAGLPKINFRVPKKNGRGGKDKNLVIECLKDSWDDFQEKINDMSEEHQEAYREYFNELIEEEEDLGDTLFGGKAASDFDSRMGYLEDTPKQTFVDELFKKR